MRILAEERTTLAVRSIKRCDVLRRLNVVKDRCEASHRGLGNVDEIPRRVNRRDDVKFNRV